MFYELPKFKEYKEVIDYDVKDNIIGQAHVNVNDGYGHGWIVKEGDTVFTIAKWAYGDSSKYTEILKKNNLKNKNQIKVGMYLCL